MVLFINSAALDEARDINTYLKPLRKHLEEFEQLDFPEVKESLAPMLHVIGLIWGNSAYYCRPGRIIVLLQEIGNLLIDLVSTFFHSILLHCRLLSKSIAFSTVRE